MLKKFLLILLLVISSFSFAEISYGATREVGNPDIKNALIETTSDSIVEGTADDGIEATIEIFTWIKDILSSLIVLVSVGVFLFIGIKLTMARGNPEEFKKAMMQMVYAVVGIFIASISWAMVVLVAGINF